MAFNRPEKITVLYCAPGKEAKIIEIYNSRDVFKKLLNDTLELVRCPTGKHVLVCRDSAGITGGLPNRSLRNFNTCMNKIIGPFFICGYNYKGKSKFVSLSESDIDKFLEEFGEPEFF